MEDYQNFVGIDIGKYSFVVAVFGRKTTSEYENNSAGIMAFLTDYKSLLSESLCILEATGGHELTVLYALVDQAIQRIEQMHAKLKILFVPSAVK